MQIHDIINTLIKKFKYTNYIQVKGENISDQILLDMNCYKTSVPEGPFDLIYLGLTESAELYEDIKKALDALTDTGAIVIGNLNPRDSSDQLDKKDSWRAWVTKRQYDFEITQTVIDTDGGVGVIQKGQQVPWEKPGASCYNYYYLNFYRKGLLNLISLDDFINWAYANANSDPIEDLYPYVPGGLYGMTEGYTPNLNVGHYDAEDKSNDFGHPTGEFAQYEAYIFARSIADKYELKTIVDVGCGMAENLVKYFKGLDTTGVEVEPCYSKLVSNFPDNKWVLSGKPNDTFEHHENIVGSDLVISMDVIEHVKDPDKFIDYLISLDASYYIVSTPCRNWDDYSPLGPPSNSCHFREWSYQELHRYIESHFDIIEHINNRDVDNFYQGNLQYCLFQKKR